MSAPRRILLTRGHILSMDPATPDLEHGDLLLEDGRIAAIGSRLDAGDAEVVDVSGHVVMPGFVDSHRHLWQGALRGISADQSLGAYFGLLLGTIAPRFTPDDVRAGTLIGGVEALDAGVTSIFDWCNATSSPAHAEAAIEALQASGIRAVYGHGNAADAAHVRALRGGALGDDDALVTLGLALAGPEHATLEATAAEIGLARELGIVASMHVGGGTVGPRARGVTRLKDAGLLGPDLNFTHCNTISDDEVAALVAAGCGISATPAVECLMGHGTPADERFRQAGGRPSLAVDVVVAAGPDLFAQMRCALTVARAAANQARLDQGRDPETVAPAAADLLRATTIDGARAIGLDGRIGSLTVGKRGDVVVLDAAGLPRDERLPGAIVTTLGPAAVRAVLVDGRFVKRDGRLLDHDLTALRLGAAERAGELTVAGVPS